MIVNFSPEERAVIALHLAPGIGPKTLAAMLDRFGSAENVLAAPSESLSQIPYLKKEVALALRKVWANGDVDAEIALLEKHGVNLFLRGNPGYPAQLDPLPGMPTLLYVRGQLPSDNGQSIAIVGSRGCTSYGRRFAHRIAYDLAKAGFTIVSGLARGIDAEAHRGALEAGGRTIAVLANGLSRVYPPEHAELAEAVAKSGAVVSEACMRMDPMPGMFPARNRIISGLSRGVVVIEAGDKSGALITARHAGEQGREVFVLPGNVDSASSAGSLELLRKGGRLVRSSRDVLEDLQGLTPLFDPKPTSKPTPKLDGVASQVWEALIEPLSIDMMCQRIGQPISAISPVLMTLEMDGLLRKLPGNVYERM